MTQLHDPDFRNFASDNYAGAHPEVIAAIVEANGGHQVAYGGDVYTERLRELVRETFGPDAQAFPVFTGTGANVTALMSVLPRWGTVLTTSTAHIHTDEAGAPGGGSGLKLLTVPAPEGKLTPELIDEATLGWGDDHRAQPLAVSITQPTEVGTLYSVAEIRAIADHVHERGMVLHMDGARVANAAAGLGVGFREFTTDAGVDILSFGGTKNGLLYGEMVIVLTPQVAEGLVYLRKLTMQLGSKMRFLSAQLIALLTDGLWLRSASHANAMAKRLRDGLLDAPGLEFTHATEANAVLVILPPGVAERLHERYSFYDWNPASGEVRWMTAFDTTEADVDEFVAAVRRALAS